MRSFLSFTVRKKVEKVQIFVLFLFFYDNFIRKKKSQNNFFYFTDTYLSQRVIRETVFDLYSALMNFAILKMS